MGGSRSHAIIFRGGCFARPLGAGPFPGVVLIHHAPGWDEWYRETTREFAHHGYATISHNLFHRLTSTVCRSLMAP